MAESCTTATRLEVLARERMTSPTGPRRWRDELKEGWRWVGNWVGVWGYGIGVWKLVEPNEIGVRVPAVETEAGLAGVGGGGDEVDRDVIGGDEAGEVEELVEMALCNEGHHHHHHLGCHFLMLCFYDLWLSIIIGLGLTIHITRYLWSRVVFGLN
ncbi:hypothetical protein L1987_51044 [Smallanthus sonchifolius]|uniref:Uncharacterized protein n=1 Tax=Smallanthus sonchifolius TaxID=185202 RepID=A0ACB9EQB2_9ASTR|nr:hypothetical protein L1987_51044 [Smallanthus sonchifolius]